LPRTRPLCVWGVWMLEPGKGQGVNLSSRRVLLYVPPHDKRCVRSEVGMYLSKCILFIVYSRGCSATQGHLWRRRLTRGVVTLSWGIKPECSERRFRYSRCETRVAASGLQCGWTYHYRFCSEPIWTLMSISTMLPGWDCDVCRRITNIVFVSDASRSLAVSLHDMTLFPLILFPVCFESDWKEGIPPEHELCWGYVKCSVHCRGWYL
jgi:hypothetical protein